jgi:hypothetical protein
MEMRMSVSAEATCAFIRWSHECKAAFLLFLGPVLVFLIFTLLHQECDQGGSNDE